MTTFVLVPPGACHGGWCFDDLAAACANRATGCWHPP